LSRLDREIASFLAAEKTVVKAYRWGGRTHPDYLKTKVIVVVVTDDGRRGELHMTSHIDRIPRKYGFSLTYRNAAIMRLDINPGRAHTNFSNLMTVKGSHWHMWPDLGTAIPDGRILDHKHWFKEFCKEARIVYLHRYTPPRHSSPDPGVTPLQKEFGFEYDQGRGT
jgi:hypothetical protein